MQIQILQPNEVTTKNEILDSLKFSLMKRLLLITVVFIFYFEVFAARDAHVVENKDSLLIISGNVALLLKQLQISGNLHGESVHAGSVSNTNLELKQICEKTDHPWYYKLSIILRNESAEKFSALPTDSLFLSLGPGLGQKFTCQSNLSPSNDPDVEPVASVNGKVITCRAESKTAVNLPWATHQLKWAGLQNRYFALLVLPAKNEKNEAYLPFTKAFLKLSTSCADTSITAYDLPFLSFRIPVNSLAPGQQNRWEFLFFYGPKSQDALASGPVNLNSLLFSGLWGWMRWICFGMLGLLSAIHFIIPNWGWSIIVLAFIIRILLYPVAKTAMKSQQRFVDAQKRMLPELKEIKKTFKGGEQSERILQLYKKHNVSPFAGLKPLLVVLIQLPVLIALFHVLGSVYELRDARFLWIDTLAEPDKLFYLGLTIPLLGSYFNLLPFLMAVFTLLSFKLAPAPTPEQEGAGLQNLFLVAMVLFFFFLFYSFPAGMVLYWTFANVFHIAQHQIMLRKAEI